MNELSKTVARNIKRTREDAKLSRSGLVQLLNRRGSARWTESKLVNVEHAKGEIRSITIDEILDLCEALDVTAFHLTIPDDEPERSRHWQISLFGFETPGTDWIDTMGRNADLLSRLRWHPDVISHSLPFWVENEYLSFLRDSIEDDLQGASRTELIDQQRSYATEMIEAQKQMISLKRDEFKRMGFPAPDDAQVNRWIKVAEKKQAAAFTTCLRERQGMTPYKDSQGQWTAQHDQKGTSHGTS